MTRSPHTCQIQTPSQGPLKSSSHATVASLGVRVQLVPAGSAREHRLKDLIASCETLRTEWECLFQRIMDLLSDDAQSGSDSAAPSPLSSRD